MLCFEAPRLLHSSWAVAFEIAADEIVDSFSLVIVLYAVEGTQEVCLFVAQVIHDIRQLVISEKVAATTTLANDVRATINCHKPACLRRAILTSWPFPLYYVKC